MANDQDDSLGHATFPAVDITDDNAFEVLREVLAGRRRIDPDVGTSKMLDLLTSSDTDAEITRGVFQVWYQHGRSKSRSTYFRRIGPRLVSTLMVRAGLTVLDRPTLVRFPAGSLDAVGRSRPCSTAVWMFPEPGKVTIKTRAVKGNWTEVSVEPAPVGGPLEPEDLETWHGSEETFAPSRPCPRCGATSASYRDYGTFCVCMACGRSFSV